jgi:hypothetical protein
LFSGSGHGHHRDMSDSSRPQTPEHADLVADLKVLREKGLIRLRQLDLPALSAAALAAGLAAPDARGPRTQEEILRRAVEALGEEETGLAAAYLFGLVRGTIGWRTKDLRERAASFYGLSAESFRKEPEQLLIGRVAEEILRLCDTPNRPDSQRDGAQRTALTPRREGSAARDLLLRHMNRIMVEHSSGPEHPRATLTIGPLPMPGGPEGAEVTVYQGLMEELQGIDVLVSSENTFLELAKPFKSSLSAHLRRAAARRGPGGAVLDDIVDTELRAWVEAYGHPGLPVESGCVAPTSSGQLDTRLPHRRNSLPGAGFCACTTPPSPPLAPERTTTTSTWGRSPGPSAGASRWADRNGSSTRSYAASVSPCSARVGPGSIRR